jgi:hypothetical protein
MTNASLYLPQQQRTMHQSIDNLSRKERLAIDHGQYPVNPWPSSSPLSPPLWKKLVIVASSFNYGLMCVWLVHTLRVAILTADDRWQWLAHLHAKTLVTGNSRRSYAYLDSGGDGETSSRRLHRKSYFSECIWARASSTCASTVKLPFCLKLAGTGVHRHHLIRLITFAFSEIG